MAKVDVATIKPRDPLRDCLHRLERGLVGKLGRKRPDIAKRHRSKPTRRRTGAHLGRQLDIENRHPIEGDTAKLDWRAIKMVFVRERQFTDTQVGGFHGASREREDRRS